MTTPAEPAAPGGIPAGWKLPRLRITRDGEWLHEGEEVTHPGILANLRENLKVDADGHYLVAGPARVPVELEDAPFVVLRVAVEGDRLVATLNDLSREPLDPETLSFDGGGRSPLPGERRDLLRPPEPCRRRISSSSAWRTKGKTAGRCWWSAPAAIPSRYRRRARRPTSADA